MDAYEEYRRSYKRDWYERNKDRVLFKQWIRTNPQYENYPNIENLFKEYGAVETKRIIRSRNSQT